MVRRLSCIAVVVFCVAGHAQALDIWGGITTSMFDAPKGTCQLQLHVYATCTWPEDVSFMVRCWVADDFLYGGGCVGQVDWYKHWIYVSRICLPSGEHTFKLELDYEQQVDESNEDNNTVEETFTWEQANWTYLVHMHDGDDGGPEYGDAVFRELADGSPNHEVNVVVMRDRGSATDYIVNADDGDYEPSDYNRGADGWYPEDIGLPAGELHMGSEESLRIFGQWGVQSFPADHYAIMLWGHGSGWAPKGPGGEGRVNGGPRESSTTAQTT